MQNEYGNKFMDKDVLISGTWPVMYHVLKAKPQTCMVYMHSIVSNEGLKLMKDCLKTKTFDYFIHIKSNIEINYPNNQLDQLNLHIIESRNMVCDLKKLDFKVLMWNIFYLRYALREQYNYQKPMAMISYPFKSK